MAVQNARAFAIPLDMQLNTVGGVHHPHTSFGLPWSAGRSAARTYCQCRTFVESGVRFIAAFFLHEKAADFGPQVQAFDASVVQHVWRASDNDAHFRDVR